MEIVVNNEAETHQWAEKLALGLKPAMLIRLEGQLGAGKTSFTKGLAKGLGIDRVIKSPSYTLIREYKQGRLPLYHIDLYRLEDGGVEELGLDEYFYGDGVSVVEWGSVCEDEMPEESLFIHIETGDQPDQRRLQIEARGQKYQELLDGLD